MSAEERDFVCAELDQQLLSAHTAYRERKAIAERHVSTWKWFTRSPLELEPFGNIRLGVTAARRLAREPANTEGYTEAGFDEIGTIWCVRSYLELGWHYETFVLWNAPCVDEWLYSYNWLVSRPVDEPYQELPTDVRPAFWVRRQLREADRVIWSARVSNEFLEWEDYTYDGFERVVEIRCWKQVRAGVLRGQVEEVVQRPEYAGDQLSRIGCFENGQRVGAFEAPTRKRRR